MPPEALEDKSRYNVTIDIFSLGVLTIFTLSQMFPKPLAPNYVDVNKKVVARTELERRDDYMQEVKRQFWDGHPLVQMIQQCLSNVLEERPTIQEVMEWLEEARDEVEDGEYDVNKLSLAQLLQSRNQENYSLREQNDALKKVQKAEIKSLEELIQRWKAVNPDCWKNVCKISLSLLLLFLLYYVFLCKTTILPCCLLQKVYIPSMQSWFTLCYTGPVITTATLAEVEEGEGCTHL